MDLPGLDATNWRANLAIRFGVILRKVWSGNRTWRGARAQAVVMSVWRSCWEQGQIALFHLVCQHTKREFLRGQVFEVWGYNDSMLGPMIELVEGDRVRIMVHNNLPETTTLHLHCLKLPIALEGVPGLTQDPIPPGGMFVYPRQSLGFPFVGDAPLNERVIAGPGKFKRLPLTLFTDGIPPARFPVDRHQIDDPRYGLLGHSR